MECQIHKFLHMLGKKWTVLILFEFCSDPSKKIRYSKIKNSFPDITPKVLSERLQQLVDEGIIEKHVDRRQVPIKTKYYFTEKGKSLIPLIAAARDWVNNCEECKIKDVCNKCDF